MHEQLEAAGDYARSWASSLPPTLPAVVAEQTQFAAAFRRAAERRIAGEPFFAIPLFADLRIAYVRRRALALMSAGTLDEQLTAIKTLATESTRPDVISVTPELQLPAANLRVLRDFVLAAEAVVLRSFAELRQLRAMLPELALQRVAVLAGATSPFSAPRSDAERDTVVVWAPHHAATELGIESAALALAGRPAAVVCRTGRLEGLNAAFLRPSEAAGVLARARLLVVADPRDPAPVVACADTLPVIAPSGNPAGEEVEGFRRYDPVDIAALAQLIGEAWNDAPPRRRPTAAAAVPFVVPEDPRATRGRELATTAWHLVPTYDFRRDAFDRIAVAGSRIDPAVSVDATFVREVAATGARFAFESARAVARAEAATGQTFAHTTIAPGSDPLVPAAIPSAARRDAVVVWAPLRAAAELAVIAMGLHYEKRELLFVCAGGELPGSRAQIVAPERGAAALARAAVVVDAATNATGSAVALAALGIPLAVASTSGADEYLDRVTVYDPWDHLSVFTAVANAKGTVGPIRPRRIVASALAQRLVDYRADIATDGPLVSVVLLTRNRRTFLKRALASVAAQAYQNIETIVVRNGGVAIDDIVASVPHARVLDSEVNLGVNGGLNFGTAAARGKYIAYLADDDAYLTDHIGSAVGALERTGSLFAHGGMLSVHLVPDGAGGYLAGGFGIDCDRPAEPGQMRAMNAVATPAMLIRRDVLAQTNNWIEPLGAMADYEIVMRFMLRDELVYVNRPTVIQTYRRDASQYSATTRSDVVDILTNLYAAHPLENEPWAERARATWRANFAGHQASGNATPLWYPAAAVTFEPVPYSAADDP